MNSCLAESCINVTVENSRFCRHHRARPTEVGIMKDIIRQSDFAFDLLDKLFDIMKVQRELETVSSCDIEDHERCELDRMSDKELLMIFQKLLIEFMPNYASLRLKLIKASPDGIDLAKDIGEFDIHSINTFNKEIH